MSFDCFSVEVAELVVDQLSDDVPSLRNVALVCHELLPRARFHLFIHIGVRNKEQMNALPEFLREKPHICPLVRCVTISTTDDELHSFTIFERVPVPLLTRLPNLRRWKVTNHALDFKGQHWLSLSQSTIASLHKYAARIGHLSINTLSFSGCVDLVRFVSAFSGLHTLVCEEINVKGHGTATALAATYQRSAPQCRLARLFIRRDVSEAAVVALLEISKCSLQELALHVTREQADSMKLLALGGQLSKLDTLTLSMPVEGRKLAFTQAISRIASFFKLLSDAGTEGTLEACKQLEQVLLAFPRHALKFSLAGGGRQSRSFKEDLKNSKLRDCFPTLWPLGQVKVELPSKVFITIDRLRLQQQQISRAQDRVMTVLCKR
ncbi:hypothetical protein BD311DRAFT_793898 [Dichomitus squalens]|uniref:F-box domain-containing protein n=1 Tax=Dichomitus squalens TaxID=114155 RepID=A0A4Q9N162_9APHY|nr:hypothetical protein BD311DRAFT_793898 [Dichomitus squalens]